MVPHFPPLYFGPAFSGPAFSTHAYWSRIFQSCIFHPCSVPYFQVSHFPPLHFWPSRIFRSRIFSRPTTTLVSVYSQHRLIGWLYGDLDLQQLVIALSTSLHLVCGMTCMLMSFLHRTVFVCFQETFKICTFLCVFNVMHHRAPVVRHLSKFIDLIFFAQPTKRQTILQAKIERLQTDLLAAATPTRRHGSFDLQRPTRLRCITGLTFDLIPIIKFIDAHVPSCV